MPEKIRCAEFEDWAVLYAAGELEGEVRADIEEHARLCAGCAATLRKEMALREAVAARGEAANELDGSGLLLARCRSELSEALDDRENANVRTGGWRQRLSPARWAAEFRRALVFHPGWSTAALLVAGALGGVTVRAWYNETSLPLPGKPAMTVSAAPRLSDQELETMAIQGIHLESQDGGTGSQVDVQLLSQQPVNVQGTLDDADIRRLLIYVAEHGQKFDPGVRLDTLEILQKRADDPEVRAALCAAARTDDNPAVRLRALEALNDRSSDQNVQQTVLGALAGDDNAGVRIEAVNQLLAAMASGSASNAKTNSQALKVLRDREQHDPNSYVRLRSAAALWQFASADGNSDLSRSGSSLP